MKVRSDFVSNSSSCSFIISSSTGTLYPSLNFFSTTFKDTYIPCTLNNNIELSFYVKNKWFQDVYEAVNGKKCQAWSDYFSDWSTGSQKQKDPEDVDWNGIVVTLDQLLELGQKQNVINKVDHIRFQCEDSDNASIMYLRLLYQFFERNMFCPDARDSEHSFLNTGEDDFMVKLAVTCKKD